jgi:hypothetical protein
MNSLLGVTICLREEIAEQPKKKNQSLKILFQTDRREIWSNIVQSDLLAAQNRLYSLKKISLFSEKIAHGQCKLFVLSVWFCIRKGKKKT